MSASTPIDARSLVDIMMNTELDWGRALDAAHWVHAGDLISQREGNRRWDVVHSLAGLWAFRIGSFVAREIKRLEALEEYDGA